ncbi:hypothetical protein RRG08_003142 [Elysia crispata]|uniref:MADF domain-containing protein n=1 Tax=Elysia crispata TaxID=231223 RepID=A0AAE1B709_9GAST|nr:hypothetical protein RRG08_003142 [Elysia crispata]
METETLIQAVEKRKWLYDKADENYSNRNFITSEWKKVATEVGCSGASRNQRIKKMRRKRLQDAPTLSGPKATFIEAAGSGLPRAGYSR